MPAHTNRGLTKRNPLEFPRDPVPKDALAVAINALENAAGNIGFNASESVVRDIDEALSKVRQISVAVATPGVSLRRRAAAAMGHETFVNLMTIELSGHEQCGTSFECEVEFFCSSKGYAASWEDPGAPDEYEVVSVRPYINPIVPETGRRGTVRTMLDCPDWLEELLIDCVDVSRLDEHQHAILGMRRS